MSPRKLWPFVILALVVVPTSAFAQTGTVAAAAPELTPTLAVVMLASLLAGFVSHSIQSGSFLGIATVPKPWLPELTVLGTFLAGAVAYMTGTPGFVLTASTAFFAVAAGLAALGMGAVPGLTSMAHVLSPMRRLATRMAAKKPPSGGAVTRVDPAADTIPPATSPKPPPAAARMALNFAFPTLPSLATLAMAVFLIACPQAGAVVPPTIDCGSRIVQDAIAGMTVEQIIADAGPACGADLLQVLTTLLASQDARVVASKAYLEAVTVKGALIPPPGGGPTTGKPVIPSGSK